jgi:hypothetical protein
MPKFSIAFEDGMEWVNNAAAGGLNDGVDTSHAFMTNSLYGDGSDEFQDEDDADLPPGPIELNHDFGVDANELDHAGIEQTNYATRLLDDQDSKDEARSVPLF